MDQNIYAQLIQIGTGAAFVIFPLIFIFAFSLHPGLLKPRLLNAEKIIWRARRNQSLQFGHVLVLLCTGLLVIVAIHFMKVLSYERGAWAGLAGAILAVLGAIILAADKGALCLTMSAFDTLPDEEFSKLMPGLLPMFSKKG